MKLLFGVASVLLSPLEVPRNVDWARVAREEDKVPWNSFPREQTRQKQFHLSVPTHGRVTGIRIPTSSGFIISCNPPFLGVPNVLRVFFARAVTRKIKSQNRDCRFKNGNKCLPLSFRGARKEKSRRWSKKAVLQGNGNASSLKTEATRLKNDKYSGRSQVHRKEVPWEVLEGLWEVTLGVRWGRREIWPLHHQCCLFWSLVHKKRRPREKHVADGLVDVHPCGVVMGRHFLKGMCVSPRDITLHITFEPSNSPACLARSGLVSTYGVQMLSFSAQAILWLSGGRLSIEPPTWGEPWIQ